MVQSVPIKAFLQTSKTVTLCTGCLKYACPPRDPYHTILLAQNLAPTDNMQPKLHDKSSVVKENKWKLLR